MHDALRLLREEHELQADVMQKLGKQAALFESEERVRDETEKARYERGKRIERTSRPSSNNAIPAKPKMNRNW